MFIVINRGLATGDVCTQGVNHAAGGRVDYGVTIVVFVADCDPHRKIASVLDDIEPVLQEKVDIEGSNLLAQLCKRNAIRHQQEGVIKVGDYVTSQS